MPNRLAGETSPYLLQHAGNPVEWYPWGPEALARARLLDRPIFLSIGYAACHWCHVMERESFEHEPTARYLNDHFVSIKVDREERPDLDQVYMAAVQSMTGGGGWPMSVFLTPDGRPFYGGTYFPDEPRHGMPSFRQVLEGVERAWREGRNEVETAGARLVQGLADQARLAAGDDDPTTELLDRATAAIEASFDTANGGWGGAPKFPQPMTIEYLLRRHVATGDPRPLAVARRSLDAMADGGLRDQLGGGFHRYSTDARWLVPHFEQMLYDNAQLARVYVHAWSLTGDERYLAVAVGTLDYMVRELTTDDGAFAASQDADTDGIEGLTFTWRATEIRDALGDEAGMFEAAYGVTDEGNWEGVTILSRVITDAQLAEREGLTEADIRARLIRDRSRLLERRATRPQPARDGKALAAWNGLAIAALADAASALSAVDPDAASAYAGCGQSRGVHDRGWTARAGRRARPLVEGWPGGRLRRPRGLRGSRRRPAGAVRGDLRRALVRDRPRPDGSRPGPLRRSGRRLLRHRRRPRAARHPTQGCPGQRGPVGQCDGGPRPAPAGRVDRRRCLPACRGTGDAYGRPVRRPLPDRVRPMARCDGPGTCARPRDRDRGRTRQPRRLARSWRRFVPDTSRTWSWRWRRMVRRARCRCSTTDPRSTAGRAPMSAEASRAACR